MDIQHFALGDSVTIRFPAGHTTPILSVHKSRHGDTIELFVGGDHRSVWVRVRRGVRARSAPLAEDTFLQIADEATRRHPHGLTQPHWARVAAEWIFRGDIDMDYLAGCATMKAVACG